MRLIWALLAQSLPPLHWCSSTHILCAVFSKGGNRVGDFWNEGGFKSIPPLSTAHPAIDFLGPVPVLLLVQVWRVKGGREAVEMKVRIQHVIATGSSLPVNSVLLPAQFYTWPILFHSHLLTCSDGQPVLRLCVCKGTSLLPHQHILPECHTITHLSSQH